MIVRLWITTGKSDKKLILPDFKLYKVRVVRK